MRLLISYNGNGDTHYRSEYEPFGISESGKRIGRYFSYDTIECQPGKFTDAWIFFPYGNFYLRPGFGRAIVESENYCDKDQDYLEGDDDLILKIFGKTTAQMKEWAENYLESKRKTVWTANRQQTVFHFDGYKGITFTPKGVNIGDEWIAEGPDMIRFKDGTWLMKDFGKYSPNLNIVYRSAKECIHEDSTHPPIEAGWGKGTQVLHRGEYFISKKGQPCFKVLPEGKQLLLLNHWGQNHDRGGRLDHLHSIWKRRASSNGGGNGTDYCIIEYPYEYVLNDFI